MTKTHASICIESLALFPTTRATKATSTNYWFNAQGMVVIQTVLDNLIHSHGSLQVVEDAFLGIEAVVSVHLDYSLYP
jgi:hypothetical protein